MRILCFCLLIFIASGANAQWQSAKMNPTDLLVSMAGCIELYISGKGDALKHQLYSASPALDKREFIDMASGEHWVLIKADALVENEPETSDAQMTATIISYGLGGSLLITLLSLGFGFREFLNEC
ncbi:MAG TPA: hypothetical protein VIC08_14910 [Cellvibrionaceae bacterium]